MIDLEGQLKNLRILSSVGLPYLIETWQDVLGIDATVWTTVVGATGTVVRSTAEEPYQKVILDCAATGDTARLRTNQQWQLAPDTWGLNTFNKALVMEWEARIVDVDDIEENGFFMGLSNIALATRVSNDIVGFILNADVINAISDDAGSETLSTVGGPIVTNWNKFAIVAYANAIEFWVNEIMQARHTTTPGADDLPDINAYGNLVIETDGVGAGAAELHVATVSIRPGVIA